MEFNLRNNGYSTEFKNKPKFKPISHKLFSNEELKKDSDFIKFGLQKRDRKTSSYLPQSQRPLEEPKIGTLLLRYSTERKRVAQDLEGFA